MIDDETFEKELTKHLKTQKLCKMSIMSAVKTAMKLENELRDAILEEEFKNAIKYQAKEKIPSEAQEQKWLVEWWRKAYPSHLIYMNRNDGTRTAREKTEQIAMGIHPGVADLHIPILSCYVEMKRTKNWHWPEEQKNFKSYVEGLGDRYILGIGFEDAKKKILDLMKEKGLNDLREEALEVIR